MPAIQSFTFYAFKKISSSNILYPSNCEEVRIPDRGSIRASIEDTDLFSPTAKNSYINSFIGKPIRYVARVVAIVAIAILISPIGMIYHGASAAYYGVKAHRNHGGLREQALTTASNHGKAFSADLVVSLLGLGLIGAVYAKQLPTSLHSSLGNMLGASGLGVFLSALAPEYIVEYSSICPSEQIAFHKSIQLKNEYGIVGLDGNPLEYDIQADDEGLAIPKGHFYSLWETEADTLITHLQKQQSQLQPQQYGVFYSLVTSLKDNEINFEKLGLLNRTAQFQNDLEELKVSFEKYKKLKNHLADYYRIKKRFWEFNFPHPQKIDQFHPSLKFTVPYSAPKAGAESESKSESQTPPKAQKWEDFLKTATPNLTMADTPFVKGNKKIASTYNKIKKLALSLTSFKDFFDIKIIDPESNKPRYPTNKRDLTLRYRQLALKIHPDKSTPLIEVTVENKDKFQKESEELFKIIEEARQRLEGAFTTSQV